MLCSSITAKLNSLFSPLGLFIIIMKASRDVITMHRPVVGR